MEKQARRVCTFRFVVDRGMARGTEVREVRRVVCPAPGARLDVVKVMSDPRAMLREPTPFAMPTTAFEDDQACDGERTGPDLTA